MRQAGSTVTRHLHVARRGYPRGHFRRSFRGRRQDQIGGGHRRHLDPQIDAIHQRA